MVDIHSHILPGLDDGPKTLEDAVAILKIAAESGTTDIVATPTLTNAQFTFDSERIDRKIAVPQSVSGPFRESTLAATFISRLETFGTRRPTAPSTRSITSAICWWNFPTH